MQFEWRISAGNVLSLTTVLISGLIWVFTIKADIQVLAVRMDVMEKTTQQISTVLITLARQEEQIRELQRRIENAPTP